MDPADNANRAAWPVFVLAATFVQVKFRVCESNHYFKKICLNSRLVLLFRACVGALGLHLLFFVFFFFFSLRLLVSSISASFFVQAAAFAYYMYAVAGAWPSALAPVAGPPHWWFAVVGAWGGDGDDASSLCADVRAQWWRLWAHQLAHAGWAPATVHLSVQLLFGVRVNLVHTPRRRRRTTTSFIFSLSSDL